LNYKKALAFCRKKEFSTRNSFFILENIGESFKIVENFIFLVFFMFEDENSPYPNLSPKERKEKIMETKICRHCSCQFDITDKDLEFYEKVSPVFSSPSPSDIPLN